MVDGKRAHIRKNYALEVRRSWFHFLAYNNVQYKYLLSIFSKSCCHIHYTNE